MAVVSSDSLQLSAVKEVTTGVTPPTAAFQVWRTSGEGLTFSPNISESIELGGSGRFAQPGDVTGVSVAGDINFVLADFTALKEAIAGVLAATWGQCPLTGVAGGAIDDAQRITVGNQLQTFTIEKRFTNPANVKGAFTVGVSATTVAPAAAVQLTFTGAATTGSGVSVIELAIDGGTKARFEVPVNPGDDAAAVAAAAVVIINADTRFQATDATGGVVDIALKAGSGTSITTLTSRIGTDDFFYQRYRGVSYSDFSLSTTPNSQVTGTVSTVGGVPELDVLPLAGATYVAAGTGSVFTAPKVLEATVGTALGIGTHCWTSLGITISSNNRGIACIGTNGDKEVVLGTLSASITGEVYFADQAVLQALLDNKVLGNGVVTFGNTDGDVLRFDFYGNKPVSGELTAGGQGEDLTIPLEFQPTPVKVCDDGTNDWMSGLIISQKNTAPTLP